MTITGSGVGGNIGGPQIPLQRDLEATAWTQVNKVNLGIMPDNLQKVMTEISPRYVFGYIHGFGYKSSPGQPLLDHPLETTRASTPSTSAQEDEANLHAVYDELLHKLPEHVKNALNQQQQLPFEQRDSSLAALNNVLNLTSRMVVGLRQAAQPAPAGSVQEERELKNFLFPFAALNGAVASGNDVQQEGFANLQQLGPNHPNFDGLLGVLNDMGSSLDHLQKLKGSIALTPNGELDSLAKTLARQENSHLAALAGQINAVSLGNDLQIVRPTMEALSSITASLVLPFPGSAPLYLSLLISTMGSDPKEGQPVIGPDLQTLSHLLGSNIVPSSNQVGTTFLNMLVQAALTTIVSASGQLAEGFGAYPPVDEATLKETKAFASELFLTTLASTGWVESLFAEGIAISGGQAEQQTRGASALAAASYLLFAQANHVAGGSRTDTVLENQRAALLKGAVAAEQLQESRNLQGSTAGVALSQMRMALEEKNADEFAQITQGLLEQAGTSASALEKDIGAVQQTAHRLTQISQEGASDKQFTQIVHIV